MPQHVAHCFGDFFFTGRRSTFAAFGGFVPQSTSGRHFEPDKQDGKANRSYLGSYDVFGFCSRRSTIVPQTASEKELTYKPFPPFFSLKKKKLSVVILLTTAA